MAESTVSKDSEGIYTELVFPDQDVYSTLDHTSPNNPGDQHQENSAGSSHPDRRAAVCLGLLCFLLLAAASVLCVLYKTQYQNSLLERNLEELGVSYSTMIQERDLLQRNYTMLNKERDLLQRNYTILKQERDQLQRNFTIFRQTVLEKLPFIDQYCPYSSQKRECKPCLQGWELFDSKCYYFCNESKSWTESRTDCIKRGADLVIIESPEEQDFISENAKYDFAWIGLSDSVTEGTWLWVDGSPLQGGFWGRGEPDDYYWSDSGTWYRGADCVVTVQGEKRWRDTYCNWVYRFICETDVLLL